MQNFAKSAGWELSFFSSFPKTDDEVHQSYYNVLLLLFENFGGDKKLRPQPPQQREPLFAEDGIGPVTWEGGPVSKAERIKLLTGLGQYKPFSKRKLSKISRKLAKRTPNKVRETEVAE